MMIQSGPHLFWALKQSLQEGYNRDSLRADVLAGLVVAVAALPLGMALAIASGVPPQYGLYTIIIGGGLTALLGGSRFQISGPTAAFVVLLVPVVQEFGLQGLMAAGFLSGLVLIALALFKMGDLIRLIPHPVTTGFTSGIALVIAVIQVKDLLGLRLSGTPEHFWDRLYLLGTALPTWRWQETLTGFVTLALLFYCARKFKKIPAPIIVLSSVTLVTWLIGRLIPGFQIDTIGTRFADGIPSGGLNFQGLGFFESLMDWEMLGEILPSALAIAALGAIESLLSASVAEGMSRKPFHPNSELLALGIANCVGPAFGGIPATGAIARTSVNVRFGARSPLSGVFHAIFVLIVLIALAPLANALPMSSMAALLVFVAYNMAERHHFINLLKNGQSEDKKVLLICFFLTVLFDMTIGVGVGFTLACLLFIRRASQLAYVRPFFADEVPRSGTEESGALQSNYCIYEVGGPMFFGAAYRALSQLTRTPNEIQIVILDLNRIHLMDGTGLLALKSSVETLLLGQKQVRLVTPDEKIRKSIIEFTQLEPENERVRFYSSLDQAIPGRLEEPIASELASAR